MLGKLAAPSDLIGAIHQAHCEILMQSAQAAEAITTLVELIKHDPFDRMLLAQAKAEGLQLMTADRKLIELGLDFIIDARH